MTEIDISRISVNHTTMGGMLAWHAAHRPLEIAVKCEDAEYSWQDLNGQVNQCSNALLALGLQAGDNVAVMMPNNAETIVLYLACARLGISVTPINYHLAGREVAHILGNSSAKAVLYHPEKKEIFAGLLGSGEVAAPASNVLEWGTAHTAFDELVAAASAESPPVPEITGEEIFFIGYTSGTTGFPKGCPQKHRRFVEHYRLTTHLYGDAAGESMLIPGPLFHEAPTLFAMAHLFVGGQLVIMPSFDPAKALSLVEQHRCAAIGFAVPTMLERMIECSSTADTSSVKFITVGGAPFHAKTMDATLALFPSAEIFEFYGATEIGLAATIGHRAEGRPGSCGRAVPGVSVCVLDENGAPVPAGTKGAVYMTPVLMMGYLNNEKATARGTVVINGVPWFTLGDVGYLDEAGYLYLVDRVSHMIISGGENIYPAEVEAALVDCPSVLDIAVVGAPDETWGETVVAVVVTNNPDLTVDDLRAFLDGRLAKFKWPRQMRIVSELPRTPSGKVQKHLIKLG